MNIKLYVSIIPDEPKIGELFPKERMDEINETKNSLAKAQKYYAWKTLEYAVRDSLGLSLCDVRLEKKENGRWCAHGFDFSISHSSRLVAAVVSESPVGVDVEEVKMPRSKEFYKKILSENELREYDLAVEKTEYLICKWTEKEALFKLRDLSAFLPKKTVIEEGEYTKSEILRSGAEKYILTVASREKFKLTVEHVEF